MCATGVKSSFSVQLRWPCHMHDLSKYTVPSSFVGMCLPTTVVGMLVVSALPTKVVGMLMLSALLKKVLGMQAVYQGMQIQELGLSKLCQNPLTLH